MNKKLVKISMLLICMCVFAFSSVNAVEISPGTTLGGHFMFFNHDSASGTRTYKTGSSSAETTVTDGRNAGAYASWLILFFNHKVNDWITLEFAPQVLNTVGATPSFGNNVGKARTIKNNAFALGQGETPTAKVIMDLPGEYELTVGQFYQRFTWAYGDSLSWQDHMMCPRQMYRSAQNIHDSGAQLYKTVNINGYSLPVTVALGNGNSFNPEKDQKMSYLAKIEPEFAGVKFNAATFINPTVIGTDYRGTVGFMKSSGPWYVRAEYMASRSQAARTVNAPATSNLLYKDTAKKDGYNLLVEYKLMDNLKLMTQYLYDDLNGTTVNDPSYKEKYKDIYVGFIYKLTDGADIIGTYEMGDYTKKNPNALSTAVSFETLKFDRIELGTKITF